MGLFDDVLEEKKPAKAGQSLFADVLEEPKPLGQRVMDVAGRLGERFKIGSVTPVSGGLQAVNEFFDQGMVPLRIAMGKEWSDQYGDPLGFRERAQAAQAVTREALADQQAVAQRTAARPESLGQALTNPVETLDYYGGIGAESAPTILAAMATRRPQAATTLIGATTAGQTYGSGRAQGLTPEQAGTEAAISGVLEAGLGKLPLSEAFSAGARRFVTAPLTEAVTEAATTGAQGSLGTILRGEAYDPNEQLRNAVDAAIVGGAMGLGEAALGGAPRTPQAEAGLFDDVLRTESNQDALTLPTPEQQAATLGLASRPVEATPVVSTEQAVPETQPERRADAVEDARLAELRAARRQGVLSPEDTAELLDLTERDRRYSRVAGRRIPGVLNMEARNEAEAAGELKPVQAFADADNFKAVNDRLGHEVGDDVIRQMGGLFAEQLGEGNVFHRGGDEFVMQADTPEQLSAAMEAVRNQLAQSVLRVTLDDGSVVEQNGVGFSYGAGPTIQEAESAQYQDKSARKAAGLRTDRTPDAGPSGAAPGTAGPQAREGATDSAAQAVTPTALPVATGGVGTPVVVPGGRPDATITPNAVELAQPSPSTAEQDNGTTQVPSSASDPVGQRPAARPASGVPARGRDAGSPADAGQQRNPPDSGGGADVAAPSNRPDERGRPESGAARRGGGEDAGEEGGRGREAQGQAGQEDRTGEEGRREAPESSQEGKVTGTKNAVMEAERSREGRDPIVRDARRSNQETVDSAIKTLQDQPSRGAEVVERLRSQGVGSISLEDEAVLLVHKTKLRNQRNEAADVLADPKASDEAKEVARRAWERLEAEIAAIDEASYASGREWGRLGQFRQRMMAEDYSLEAMERKLRAVTEAPLTREQTAEVKALSKQLEEAQKRLEETQARLADAESVVTYDDLIKAMQQAARPKRRPTLERLREAANESRAALAAIESVPSRKGQSGAAINPAAFYHLTRIGAYHIANGVTQIADWTAKMKADLGERFNEFREMLPEVFRASKVVATETLGSGKSVDEVLAEIKPEGPTTKDVRALAEAQIRAGVRGAENVIQAVASALNIPVEQAKQLFVQSAPKRPQTQSEIRAELRDLRAILRIEKEIERLQAGEPKVRGQRSVPSQAVVAKQQELAQVRQRLREAARPDEESRYQNMRGKAIERQIEALNKRIAEGDFDKVKRIPRSLTEQNQKAAYALEQVKEEFERLRFEAEMAKRTPVQKIFGGVRDAFNLARAYMTSVDLSGLLRQGGFISFGRPLRALKSVPPSLKSFVSEKAEFEANQDIKNRPNAPLYKKFGLELTGIGSGPLTKVEEAYATRWLNKVPWLLGGGVVRGSGRAYTTMLNRIRADSFDAMLASLAKNGEKPTEAEGKAIANYINVATGRGKVGSSNNAGEVLNTVFFAPRLVASRFQLLFGQPLYGGTARTRAMVAQEYARFLIGVSIATVLAAMMKDEDDKTKTLNFDPRSADFGKIRFGDTYLDPLAQLAQVTTFLARIATGETRTSKGDLRPLRDNYRLTDVAPGLGDGEKLKEVKYGGSGADDVLFRFLRSKLAPVPGAVVNTMAGENMIGEPVTPLDTATSMVTPMSVNDIGAIMEEQGIPRGSAIILLGLLGMGVQHRAPKEEKPETAKGAQ